MLARARCLWGSDGRHLLPVFIRLIIQVRQIGQALGEFPHGLPLHTLLYGQMCDDQAPEADRHSQMC